MPILPMTISDRLGCWATLGASVRLAGGNAATPLGSAEEAVLAMALPFDAVVLQVEFAGHPKIVKPTDVLQPVRPCDGSTSTCPATRPPPDPAFSLFLSGSMNDLTSGIGMVVSDSEDEAITRANEGDPAPEQVFWLMRVVNTWTHSPLVGALTTLPMPALLGKFITIPVVEP